MVYIHIGVDSVVTDVVFDEDSMFPGIPAVSRFSQSFIAECHAYPEDTFDTMEVAAGYVYDADTETYRKIQNEQVDDDIATPEYIITQSEINTTYQEGVNDVE